MATKKVIGYQITNTQDEIPNGLFSFQIFKTAEQAFNYAREHLNPEKNWFVQQIREGDIENPTYIGSEKKIYRLEIWAEFSWRSDIHNWAYRPLSDFYTDPSELEKIKQKMIDHYNELDQKYCYFEDGTYNDNGISQLFREWEKYLSEHLNLDANGGHQIISNTHANMPEINEYILYEL